VGAYFIMARPSYNQARAGEKPGGASAARSGGPPIGPGLPRSGSAASRQLSGVQPAMASTHFGKSARDHTRDHKGHASPTDCLTFVSRPADLEIGAEGRTRTADACAFNAVLYQLSYVS
jgi:hypothetical protein